MGEESVAASGDAAADHQVTTGIPQARASWGSWSAALLLYTAIGLLICFWRLGATDVIAMEGIVADQARHMLRTGDYAVPHLYGEPYTYKPPLVAWLVAGSFKLTGVENEWSLRLPNAVCGLVMGLMVLLLVGRSLDPKMGCYCALATITAVYVVQKLRIAEFDIPLATGVGIAVAVACYNLAVDKPSRMLWLVGYLALAGGVLAKGAPAVMLYFPGLLGAGIVTRQWRRLVTFSHLAGVLLCVALVTLWVWRAYAAAGPELFDDPLIEAYGRGLKWSSKELLLAPVKPLIVGAIFLPWSLLIPLTWRRRWWRGLDDNTHRMEAGAGAFLALGIVVSMTVPTDEVRYFLPLCVPAGIVSALAGLAVIMRREDSEPAFAAGNTDAASRPAGGRDERWLLSRALPGLLAVTLVHWAVYVHVVKPIRVADDTQRPAAEAFAPYIPPEAILHADVGDSYSSLFFYLDRPVANVSLFSDHMKPGTFLILRSDQLHELDSRRDCPYTVLERATTEDDELILAKIESPA